MSLYSAFDQNNHFSELTAPLYHGPSGVISAATRQATAVANLGITASIADLNAIAGVGAPDTLTTEAGAGITNNTGGGSYSSAVTQVGNIITTTIFIDVDGLDSSTTDLDVIGFDEATDLAAHLGQITTAQNGVIFEGSMTCVEAPTGGVTDIDLYSGDDGTAVFDAAISTETGERILLTSGGAWTAGRTLQLGIVPGPDQYLYLTCGAGGTVAEYTAGQFYITLRGIAA